MFFKPLAIGGAFLISSDLHVDDRGHFTRIFCKEELEKNDMPASIVQSSLSFNKKKGTLRGMHFQKHPFEEQKIVKCVKGSIFDVIVDLRKNSSTFLTWLSVELSDQNNEALYIPKGVAHGFQTLQDDTTLIYFMTEKFNPDAAIGFCYNDPLINIKWPIKEKIMSEKDQKFPFFKKDR